MKSKYKWKPKIDPVIYMATHKKTGKRYVGMSSYGMKIRMYGHKAHGHWKVGKDTFNDVCSREGADAFIWEILERCKDRFVLPKRERHWIKKMKTERPNGYNVPESEMPKWFIKRPLSITYNGETQRFLSVGEASKKTGLDKKMLSQCLDGDMDSIYGAIVKAI